MHSSLTFLVSGQAQQIFFFGFESAGTVAGANFSSFGSCDEDVVVEVFSFDTPSPSCDEAPPILKEGCKELGNKRSMIAIRLAF